MKGARPISGIIADQLPQADDPPVANAVQQSLEEYWKSNAGIVAPHTQPLLFESGRLVVFCDSSVWSTQIRHQSPSLIHQLKHHGYAVSQIKIRLRPEQPTITSRRTTTTTAPISNATAQSLEALSRTVDNPRLGKSLARLARKAQKNPE